MRQTDHRFRGPRIQVQIIYAYIFVWKMSDYYEFATYAFIGIKWGGVADNFVDRDANREGNTLDDDLAILTLVLEDIRSSCLNQFITVFADIDDLSTWS